MKKIVLAMISFGCPALARAQDRSVTVEVSDVKPKAGTIYPAVSIS